MSARLKKDIIIPAGTIFKKAPTKTERQGNHIDTLFEFNKDSIGFFTCCLDDDLGDYFETNFSISEKIELELTKFPHNKEVHYIIMSPKEYDMLVDESKFVIFKTPSSLKNNISYYNGIEIIVNEKWKNRIEVV